MEFRKSILIQTMVALIAMNVSANAQSRGGVTSGTPPVKIKVDCRDIERGVYASVIDPIMNIYNNDFFGSASSPYGQVNNIKVSESPSQWVGTPMEKPLRYGGHGFSLKVFMTAQPTQPGLPIERVGTISVQKLNIKNLNIPCTIYP